MKEIVQPSVAPINTNKPQVPRKVYRQFKRYFIEWEKQNYNYIVALPCSGPSNWFEVPEHSALIYYYAVLSNTITKTQFSDDSTELYENYNIGYVRSNGYNIIRKRLQALNLYDSEVKVDCKGKPTTTPIHAVIFKLTKRFTSEGLAEFEQLERARREGNLAVVSNYNLDPMLYAHLRSFSERISTLANSKISGYHKSIYGRTIIKYSTDAIVLYFKICAATLRTDTNPSYYPKILRSFKTIIDNTTEIKFILQALNSVHQVTPDACVKLTEEINLIVKSATKHYNKYQDKYNDAKNSQQDQSSPTQ